MEDKPVLQSNEKKVVYQKPLLEKQKEMVFPIEIMEKFNGGRFCLQCSSCHGCR